ncbi:MAG: MarR family transcriptional regulator [Lewinellaceae bacterium]|nr:MarR family transcriptional regulator [Phaeodactylibacter sp.]MCB0614753.1 MarR family transcriptional regulator [Phaeodactylibacter sp.]MCB9348640.1 MarR family transcriptional regulator [Lewinellaceae bacterium]
MNKVQFNPLNSLVFLTNRVGRLLANEIRLRSGMERLGLMPHHMGILVELWAKDGLRQQDLAVSIIKDKATIARALDHLEAENIVVRVPDSNDKRNKHIYLTHKGKKLHQQIWPHAESVMKEVLENVEQQDLEACKRVLEHIYHKLNQ